MGQASHEVVSKITSEVTPILQETQCTVISSSSTITGTVLHVEQSCIDNELLDLIQDKARHREVHRGMWRDIDCLYLHIGSIIGHRLDQPLQRY